MMQSSGSPVLRSITRVCAFALIVVFGFGVQSASAVGPAPEAENFIPRFGEHGVGAGQTGIPAGIGTNPTTGDVYISDWGNDRINEFTPWGRFIRAFGWGVADGTSTELQTCTTTCFKGLAGTGAGEFSLAWGVVVDASGNVYVRDSKNKRVQKFSSTGGFLLMFGGEVDKTNVHKREEQEAKAEPVTVTAQEEDVCTAVSGDQCGIGVEGSGHGQFDSNGFIALDVDGTIAVGDKERIEEFEPDGTYKSEVAIPGKTVVLLAVDPKTGDFYVAFGVSGVEGDNIYRLSPSGTPLGTLAVKKPGFALATDSSGNVYVVDEPENDLNLKESAHLFEFDSTGKKIAEFKIRQAPSETTVYGLGTNTAGDLYVADNESFYAISFISAFGPPPVSFEPPPKVPPTIESEYALSSDLDSAVVQARINPHFWDDAKYYVQYGTEDCGIAACASQPAAPGSRLTGDVVDEAVASEGVSLSGLQPDTTYHYRFVSESGGGGPVFGPDRTFTTFPESGASTDCPNQRFRTGFSALLPDCRAYEMVSPIDKDGGDIVTFIDATGYENGLDQVSTGGERFTYSAGRSFGEAKGGPYTAQYLAGRDPVRGWATEAISPARHPQPGFFGEDFETDYKFFSADLSSGWLAPAPEPALAPGALEGVRTLYRRDNTSAGFEALTTVEPPSVDLSTYAVEVQGVSADGSRAVFVANGKLTSDASSETNIAQVYESDRSGGLRLISVLPSGAASNQHSSAGSANEGFTFGYGYGRLSSVDRAVSADGSRVYWSELDGSSAAPGKLYLRVNAGQEQSAVAGGECVESDKACSVAVSSNAAQFWTASTDGSRALYTFTEGARAGELDEFNLEEDTSTPVAEKVKGLLGASEDLSYIYFVSTEALGPGAKTGQRNLYVRHDEVTSFIATLASGDTDNALSPVSKVPIRHAARVTPDGRHIAFISTASLTGYDNTDVVTGEPDSEVYTYDATSEELHCVSCDRSGARPSGRVVQPAGNAEQFLPTAASISPWENELYASRVLSDDGSRVFFNSYVALVPRDTNGKEDVYEWEAPGSGDCTSESFAFSSAAGGCVGLISSGESPQDSEFVEASPSGSDVFFATSASLLPQDPGLVDIYDARVGGGFPAPQAPPAPCEGEACQGAPVPPNDQTPASAAFSGPGDLVSGLAGSSTPKKTTVHSRKTSAALSRALRACRARGGGAKRRRRCEAAARKRYGSSARRRAKRPASGRGK